MIGAYIALFILVIIIIFALLYILAQWSDPTDKPELHL